jgi:hypothetical protein
VQARASASESRRAILMRPPWRLLLKAMPRRDMVLKRETMAGWTRAGP